jgi:hypothetical protein
MKQSKKYALLLYKRWKKAKLLFKNRFLSRTNRVLNITGD